MTQRRVHETLQNVTAARDTVAGRPRVRGDDSRHNGGAAVKGARPPTEWSAASTACTTCARGPLPACRPRRPARGDDPRGRVRRDCPQAATRTNQRPMAQAPGRRPFRRPGRPDPGDSVAGRLVRAAQAQLLASGAAVGSRLAREVNQKAMALVTASRWQPSRAAICCIGRRRSHSAFAGSASRSANVGPRGRERLRPSGTGSPRDVCQYASARGRLRAADPQLAGDRPHRQPLVVQLLHPLGRRLRGGRPAEVDDDLGGGGGGRRRRAEPAGDGLHQPRPEAAPQPAARGSRSPCCSSSMRPPVSRRITSRASHSASSPPASGAASRTAPRSASACRTSSSVGAGRGRSRAASRALISASSRARSVQLAQGLLRLPAVGPPRPGCGG